MALEYSRVNWKDGETSKQTPLSAANLNIMDKGIADCVEEVEKKVEKEEGKSLSTNDFTNEDKEKLDGLENYDDTEIKEEVAQINQSLSELENVTNTFGKLLQGYRDFDSASIHDSAYQVCSQLKMSCKTGDTITFTVSDRFANKKLTIIFMNGNSVVSHNEYSMGASITVPSGCDGFHFYGTNGNGITPSDAGVVEIRINGNTSVIADINNTLSSIPSINLADQSNLTKIDNELCVIIDVVPGKKYACKSYNTGSSYTGTLSFRTWLNNTWVQQTAIDTYNGYVYEVPSGVTKISIAGATPQDRNIMVVEGDVFAPFKPYGGKPLNDYLHDTDMDIVKVKNDLSEKTNILITDDAYTENVPNNTDTIKKLVGGQYMTAGVYLLRVWVEFATTATTGYYNIGAQYNGRKQWDAMPAITSGTPTFQRHTYTDILHITKENEKQDLYALYAHCFGSTVKLNVSYQLVRLYSL